MGTVYDIVTVTCFACIVLTYFMLTEGGPKVLAHFMLPAAAFAIANQLGNRGMDVPAIILIVAGIGYTYIIVRHRAVRGYKGAQELGEVLAGFPEGRALRGRIDRGALKFVKSIRPQELPRAGAREPGRPALRPILAHAETRYEKSPR